ncbi:MAG: coproporphyrinogen III oxidase family protein [Acidobacteriota bacterium]|nr:coproporphyrinogen III oxidase family protein [Acidobacteriota bacterium]
MLDIVQDQGEAAPGAPQPSPPAGAEEHRGQPELSRKGFITAYPMFRYWNKEAVAEGLRPQPLNLYIHMPYCIQRCAYCYFKTTTLKENRLKDIDRYVTAVCKELALGSQLFGLMKRPVETVYFGGGTPTLMSEENLDRLFAALHENFTLADPQITFEGEPVTLTERKAAVLQRHNVNRISLGIQSFKEEIVFQTGRQDTEEQAMKAIELAKSTGAEVNVDLISGLAGETPETWAYSVRRAIEADVHNITIYKLELYANTPYYSAERHNEIALPGEEEELAFIKYAVAELKRHDYHPVNTFTFTKGGGHDQLNTRNRWLGYDSFACGVSAYGSLGTWNYQNTNDINGYIDSVEKGELPAFRGYQCSGFDLIARDVVMGIKLIDLSHVRFRAKHGIDLLKVCEGALSQLAQEGFVTVDDENISLTDHGVIYGDYVGRILEGSLKRWSGASSDSRARVRF